MIQMVPGEGIEPTTLSLEGFCSSTELPGQMSRTREQDSENRAKVKTFFAWMNPIF
jgi:hypothetical protein